MDLEDLFACPFSSAKFLPKRARSHYGKAMMWVFRELTSDSSDFWRLYGVSTRLLLAPIPGARSKSLPAETVRQRASRFMAGDWEALFRESAPQAAPWSARVDRGRELKDVVSLVREGQCSRAIGRIDSAALADPSEETLRQLRTLHPPATPLPPVRVAAPLVVEDEALEEVMRSLPQASGPGLTQLRFEHMGEIDVSGGREAIKNAVQLLVSNQVPEEILPWLMGARLIALAKLQGGVRPIAVGDVLRRIAGKVICAQYKEQFAVRFCPPPRPGAPSSAAQVGVATPGGAEMAPHLVRTLLGANPSWCAALLDCKNAYNELYRAAILDAVADMFPDLLPAAEACLRRPAWLGWRDATGAFRWIPSEEGAQQGDPLGPMFMAAPMQPHLEATLEAFPDVYLIAYLDDVTLVGDPARVRAAMGFLAPRLASIGLRLNHGKCKVYSPSGPCPQFADLVDEEGNQIAGAVEALDGVTVLGVPVGSAEYERSECAAAAAKLGGVLPAIAAELTDTQTQLLLLRFCAHPRFGHLLRGVPSSSLLGRPAGGGAGAAVAHDLNVERCLRRVLGQTGPLSAQTVQLSQQVGRWGGVGLTSAQRLCHAGWLGSWALVWAPMTVLFPAVAQMLPFLGAPEGTPLGDHPLADGFALSRAVLSRSRSFVADKPDGYPLPPGARTVVDIGWAAYAQPRTKMQHQFSTLIHAADWCRLYDGPGIQEVDGLARQHELQARLLSLLAPGAMAYLAAIPRTNRFRLTSGPMISALCTDLGLPQPALVGVRTCRCGATLDNFGHHYRSVCSQRGLRKAAHNNVVDEHVAMLKTVFAPNQVIREHGRHHGYSPNWRPDITVWNFDGRGTHMIIDVSIADPTCASYRRQAAATPLAAAAKHEERKTRLYQGDPAGASYPACGNHDFVPLAYELYGGRGSAAQKWFEDLRSRRHNRLRQETEDATWSARTFGAYWTQRIGCALKRTVGFQLTMQAHQDFVH